MNSSLTTLVRSFSLASTSRTTAAAVLPSRSCANGPTNNYLRVAIYAFACLTTSCVYFGWQKYSEMMMRGGAYSWLCDDTWDFENDGFCTEQEKAVTRLYAIANGSEFVCAAVGGTMLDHLGPRYTAIIGELLFALAIVLTIFSNQSFQAFIPGLILSGMSVNIVSFPSLTVVESWPTRQALVVSIIVGAQSGASIIAPILAWIWDRNPNFTHRGIFLVYLAVVWIPVSALYTWALPTNRDYVKLFGEPPEDDFETSEGEPVGPKT